LPEEERYSSKNFTSWREKKRFQMMQEIFKSHPSNFTTKANLASAKSGEATAVSVKAEQTEDEIPPHVDHQTAPLQSVGTVRNFQPFLQYKCEQGNCGRVFKTQIGLFKHRRRHTEEGKITCDECGEMFMYMRELEMHQRKHKTHKCDFCDKEFKSEGSWRMHRLTHLGKVSHKCEECGEAFPSHEDLRIHKLSHDDTVEDSFKCDICGKLYKNESSLKKHQEIHVEGKPFKCENCGKGFKREIYLIHHRRQYDKPFKCKDCDKAFATLTSLKHHVMDHTGERPFTCADCGKGFKTTSHLRQHQNRLISCKKDLYKRKDGESSETPLDESKFVTKQEPEAMEQSNNMPPGGAADETGNEKTQTILVFEY